MAEEIIDFECDNCKKIFKTKKNLRYHEVNKVCIDKEHICEYCGNTFPSIINMQRHINQSCRIKKEILEKEKYERDKKEKDEKEALEKEKHEREKKEKDEKGNIDEEKYAKVKRYNEYLKLELENQKMLKDIAELKGINLKIDTKGNQILIPEPIQELQNKIVPKIKIIPENKSKKEQGNKSKTIVKNAKTINNNIENNTANNTANIANTTNNACVINNNYNVNLVRNGSEDMQKIGLEAIVKMINGFDTAATMVQGVNFSDKYPENHNIFISNIKGEHASVFDGNEWSLVYKTDIVDRIYERQKEYVEENIDELKKLLSQSKMGALRRWLEINDDHAKIKNVKKKIKLLLYNKRNIPMKTKAHAEKQNAISCDA